MLVAGQSCPQAIDCIERARADVMKRSPVKWNEVPSLGAFEQAQSIGRGEVSPTESRLPPGSVTNRQKRYIELSVAIREMLMNHPVRLVG